MMVRIQHHVRLAFCLVLLSLPLTVSAVSMAFLGDSNTWSGGDDCSRPAAWSYHLVRNMHPDYCRSFARSGATWTNNASTRADASFYSELLHDDNVIYNQVLRLCQAVDSGGFPCPDYIFISAGTNDAWFSDRRPQLWSPGVEDAFRRPVTAVTPVGEATSLATSARLVLAILREHFPSARIVVVGPPYTVKASRADIDRVAGTLQQVAFRCGVGSLRIERLCGIDPDREKNKTELTTDGTHTSPQGAWQIANCVYNYLAFNNWL